MVKIGNLSIKTPIIQGGMAIRASMAKLAAAVANQGGLGVIAGSALPIDELKAEIKKARKMIVNEGGALGVNIMYATTDFMESVKASIEAGIDVIIFGAGFSRDIFEVVKGTGVKVIPVVSTLKLAKISQKLGADAIVVEGGNAGGHLGTDLDSWDIMEEITSNIDIPVFGAGGVITPEDARRMLKLGVDGVQMGSRFVASEECEVEDYFKEMYIKAKEGDIVQMMSSAGLPANAIISPCVERVINDTIDRPAKCVKCLKKCTYKFCVNEKLVNAHNGNYENGIFFAGKDAWKINEILSVEEIFNRFRKVFEE